MKMRLILLLYIILVTSCAKVNEVNEVNEIDEIDEVDEVEQVLNYLNISSESNKNILLNKLYESKNYPVILKHLRRRSTNFFYNTQCAEIVGIKPHVDHLIAKIPDPKDYSNVHKFKTMHYETTPEAGKVFALFYKGKNTSGTVDPAIRIGLITLPPQDVEKAPLLMWFREYYQDMDYGHIANRVGNLQLKFITATKPFPNEALKQKGAQKFVSGVSSYGDDIYDADAFDSLTFHNCIQELNFQEKILMGKDTNLEVANFEIQQNPFYKKILLNDLPEKEHKSVQSIYAGYSRGGQVATIALSLLGQFLASGRDPGIHVSALATFAPLGSYVDDSMYLRKALVTPNPIFSIHKDSIAWLYQKNYSSSIQKNALIIAQRDLAFLAPYVALALRNWPTWFANNEEKPGAYLLVMSEHDQIFNYDIQDIIYSSIQKWSSERLKNITGSNMAFAHSFNYIKTPVSDCPGNDTHGMVFECKLLKVTSPHQKFPTSLEAAKEWTREFLQSALLDAKVTYTKKDETIDYVSSRIIFEAWINIFARDALKL
jgi:hypothetical protein